MRSKPQAGQQWLRGRCITTMRDPTDDEFRWPCIITWLVFLVIFVAIDYLILGWVIE